MIFIYFFNRTICGDSQLSFFTILDSLQIRISTSNSNSRMLQTATSRLNEIIYMNVTNPSLDDLILNDFELNSKNFQSLDGRPRSIKEFQRMKNRNRNSMSRASNLTSESTSNSSNSTSTSAPNQFQPPSGFLDPDSISLIEITMLLASFNRYNMFSSSDCPFKLTNNPSNMTSTTKSCFCQTGYVFIKGMSRDTQYIFNQISPMFLGKVLYAPNTPAYNELIKRMNSTFANLDNAGQFIGSLSDLLNNVLVSFLYFV
jgi:hypothetical protein